MNGEFISIETAKIMAEIEKENKELQEKIDKAIEYIKQLEHSEWITFGRKILLEILNGGDEE